MIPVPNLDTIDFDALFTEGRGLIPRYAPAWTDHNIHDPGITILDLVAWIIDQEVYRIGFVGGSHLAAFAALLGVKPEVAVPARGLLWPTARVKAATNVAMGATATAASKPDMIFEVAAAATLSDARIEHVDLVRADRTQVSTTLDRLDGAYVVLEAGDRLMIDLDRPLAAQAVQVTLGVEVAGNVPDPGPHTYPWGPIAFDYRIGNGEWQRLDIVRDDTLALARTGVVVLAAPGGLGASATLRLDTSGGFFPRAPKLARLALNVLPVRQIETSPKATLGYGTGQPDQTVPLDLGGLLAAPKLRVMTAEDEWGAVSDLAGSGPADRHYVANTLANVLRFGNGINGRVVPPDAQIVVGPFARTQGAAGNLRKGMQWTVAGIPGLFGGNPAAMTGGSDAWNRDTLIDALRTRAARRTVMLTDADMRAAVLALPGFAVGRVDIVSRFSPLLPGRDICAARTLVVYPDSTVPASDLYLDAVAQAIAPNRVLGERLAVIAATPVTINLVATILIDGSNEAATRAATEARLRARLGKLSVDPAIAPWPLGRPVTVGEIEALIGGAKGVLAVITLTIASVGRPPGRTDIMLARAEVAVAGSIDLLFEIAG